MQSAIEKEEKGLAQLQALQMAKVNDELQDKVQRYQIELAMEKSKVDAEYERSKSLIQDKDELARSLSNALKLCDDKDKQMTRMQRAANQRRIQVKESLNTLLEDPLTVVAAPLQPNEEIEDLKSQLKISQLQLQSVCQMHIQKEQEMMQQLKALQE